MTTAFIEWKASIQGTQEVISELQQIRQTYQQTGVMTDEMSQKQRYLQNNLRQVNNTWNQQRQILYATHPALQTMTRAFSTFSHVASTALSVMNALNIASLNSGQFASQLADFGIDLVKEKIKLQNMIDELSSGGMTPEEIENDPRIKLQRQLIREIETRIEETKKKEKEAAEQTRLTMITAWINIVADIGAQMVNIWILFKVLRARLGTGITIPIRYITTGAPVPGVSPTAGIGGGTTGTGTLNSVKTPGGVGSAVGTGIGAFISIFGASIIDTVLSLFGDTQAQFREEQRKLESIAFQEKISGTTNPTVGLDESGKYVLLNNTIATNNQTEATKSNSLIQEAFGEEWSNIGPDLQILPPTLRELVTSVQENTKAQINTITKPLVNVKPPDMVAFWKDVQEQQTQQTNMAVYWKELTTQSLKTEDKDLTKTIDINNDVITINNTNLSDAGKAILKSYEEYRKNNPETNMRSRMLEEAILLATDSTDVLADQLKNGIPVNVNISGGGVSGGHGSSYNPNSPYQTQSGWMGENGKMYDTREEAIANNPTHTDDEGNTQPDEEPTFTEIGGYRAASGYEGLVSKPTMFLAGESGSEMVKITPLGSMKSSGGGTTIIQNIYVQGSILAEREVERISDRALKRDLKRVGF